MTAVAVAEQDALTLAGLVAIIEREADLTVSSSGSEIEHLECADTDGPCVLVVDARWRAEQWPDWATAVVVIADDLNDADLLAFLAAGARSVLLKSSAPSLLRLAVSSAVAGATFIDPRLTGRLVAVVTKGQRATGPRGLTVQEQRVLSLLPRRLTNREIAAELGVSPYTVKTHLQNAMRKIGASDRHQAGDFAERHGLT